MRLLGLSSVKASVYAYMYVCLCVCHLWYLSGMCVSPDIVNLYFNVAIWMALDEHLLEEKGVKVAYLHLVGTRGILKLETLVTDLEYADDMALLTDT